MKYGLDSERAAAWVYDSLKRGPSLSLAKLVADRLPLKNYYYETVADASLPDEVLYDFESGGNHSSVNSERWIVDKIQNEPNSRSQVLVAEDWRANPNSPFLSLKQMPSALFVDEVYFIIRASELSMHQYWKLILSNSSPRYHAFLLNDDVGQMLRSVGKALTLSDFEYSLKAMEGIIVGAYDGEGFVYCTAH